MSLLTAAEQRRRTMMRRLLLAVGAMLLVVTTVLVTLLVVDDAHPRSAPAAPTGQAASRAREPGTGIWTMPPVSAGPLILPRPTDTAGGIPIGFPHSTEGAVSAAAHYA